MLPRIVKVPQHNKCQPGIGHGSAQEMKSLACGLPASLAGDG